MIASTRIVAKAMSACLLFAVSGAACSQQLAKKTVDDFDGKTVVNTDGSYTVGCNQVIGNCLALAAGWSSQAPDHAALIVEIGGPSYRNFTSLRMNIDGAVTDITQKVGNATHSGT